MTAPNHIAGGFVFTGLFCSLFNVNVFASPVLIGFAVFCFLLPDIDHTKSWIGKLFYPLSKWIATNHGHRTITHSIFFWLGVSFFTLILENNFGKNHDFSFVMFFGILSHLMLDMITISGIPLFYPLYKNPCVLPANPELRLHTGNLKQEGIMLFIFSISTVFMQDLFANGFWNSINNSFGDIKHVKRQIDNNPNQMILTYNYVQNNVNFKGKGIVFYSQADKIYFFKNDSVKVLDEAKPNFHIIDLKTKKTNKKIIYKNFEFNSISEDSVNRILSKKFIISGQIISNQFTELNSTTQGKKFNLKDFFNVHFNSKFKDSLNSDKAEKIKNISLKIEAEKRKENLHNEELNIIKKQVSDKIKLLETAKNSYEIDELKNEIISLNNRLKSFKKYDNSLIHFHQSEIEIIKQKITNIFYSGYLETIDLTGV